MSTPRLLVAGLLPVQNQQIAKRYGTRADLRFITTDAGPAAWYRAMGRGFDRVLLAVKFVSHEHEATVPRDKLVRVNGSLTAMCREIEKLVPPEHEQPTITEEPPVTPKQPDTTKPVYAVVCEAIASRTPGVTFSVAEFADALGEPKGAVNAALATLAKKGLLDRKSRGSYAANHQSERAPATVTRQKRPKTYKKGKRKPDFVGLYMHIVDTMADLMEDVRLLGQLVPKEPSRDLSEYSERALWKELARRKDK